MDILIDDILEDGLEIEGTEKDPWVGGVFKEVLGEGFRHDDPAHISVHIVRFEENITISGGARYTSHRSCDRCLAEYAENAEFPLHTVLVPLHESRESRREDAEEVEINEEDLEFGCYEGDRFDLAEVIREQVLLTQPMKHLCRSDCAGLCQRCGKNLNKGMCECKEEHGDPRWTALKGVKISRH